MKKTKNSELDTDEIITIHSLKNQLDFLCFLYGRRWHS